MLLKACTGFIRLARQAGITSRRTRFVYARLAEHRYQAQHAASIRAALRIIKEPDPITWLDVPLPLDPGEDRCVNDHHQRMPIGQCAGTTWEKVVEQKPGLS